MGRVAKIGTVRPTEEFIVERYSHVMHIVSNVVGELDPDQDALSAFFAGMRRHCFRRAQGSRNGNHRRTGTRKARRLWRWFGIFQCGGGYGYVYRLRTAIVKDEKLYIQAGGGVVYDSDPEAEYMETVHKSNAIRRAAADAAMFVKNSGGN